MLGAFYFDFSLELSWLAIPAVLLISVTGVFIGYVIAHAAPKPEMAALATQVIVFLIMLFSPVMYPAEQLPGDHARFARHTGCPPSPAAPEIPRSLASVAEA